MSERHGVTPAAAHHGLRQESLLAGGGPPYQYGGESLAHLWSRIHNITGLDSVKR
ncbi:hypothetical protein ACQP2X_47135 [Actinoplanes sp. CA-131856]